MRVKFKSTASARRVKKEKVNARDALAADTGRTAAEAEEAVTVVATTEANQTAAILAKTTRTLLGASLREMVVKTPEDAEIAVEVAAKETVVVDKKSPRHKTRGQTLVETGVAVAVEIVETAKEAEAAASPAGEVAGQLVATRQVERTEKGAIAEASVVEGEAEEAEVAGVAVIAATVVGTAEARASQELPSERFLRKAVNQAVA